MYIIALKTLNDKLFYKVKLFLYSRSTTTIRCFYNKRFLSQIDLAISWNEKLFASQNLVLVLLCTIDAQKEKKLISKRIYESVVSVLRKERC